MNTYCVVALTPYFFDLSFCEVGFHFSSLTYAYRLIVDMYVTKFESCRFLDIILGAVDGSLALTILLVSVQYHFRNSTKDTFNVNSSLIVR